MQKIVGINNVTPRPHSMIVTNATSQTPATSHLSRSVARGNVSPTSAALPVDPSGKPNPSRMVKTTF